MPKKMRQIINAVVLSIALLAPVALATPVHAQLFPGAKEEACKGANLGGNCDTAAAEVQVNTVLQNAIGILSMVIGVISVIMLIIGGFKYITSSGDPNNLNGAKNTILYAIVGITVAALAQVFSRFVLSKI